MDHVNPTFLPIRKNSALIAFGDCFMDDKGTWRITCFFKSPNDIIATLTPAVEVLPALALRRVYSIGKITVEKDDLGYFQMPSVSSWKKVRMENVPSEIYKAHYLDECKRQWIYKIQVGSRCIWLPVLELGRILFLKTAENTRYAFYETNLLGMASLDFEDDQAFIRLARHYPRRLLDTKLHQEYVAWLLLNQDVTNSFCSMFEMRNSHSLFSADRRSWTFDFIPLELEGITMSVYGKESEGNFFVNEIVSVGKVPTNPRYRKVIIEHPDDIKYRCKPGDGLLPDKKPQSQHREVVVDPNVDDSEPPSADTKQRLLYIPRGKLFFSTHMEPERHFTEVDVDERKKGGKKGARDNKSSEQVNTGVTEGDTKSKNRKVDFQMLKDPNLVPTDFFKHVRSLLQCIKKTKQWEIQETVGELKNEADRFFSKIGGVKRRYFCSKIHLRADNVVTLIEIDLSDKHGLSTLVMRLPPHDADTVDEILDALVEQAGRWNKELIDQLADMAAYISHPKNLLESKGKIDYDHWAHRLLREL